MTDFDTNFMIRICSKLLTNMISKNKYTLCLSKFSEPIKYWNIQSKMFHWNENKSKLQKTNIDLIFGKKCYVLNVSNKSLFFNLKTFGYFPTVHANLTAWTKIYENSFQNFPRVFLRSHNISIRAPVFNMFHILSKPAIFNSLQKIQTVYNNFILIFIIYFPSWHYMVYSVNYMPMNLSIFFTSNNLSTEQ